MGEWNLADHDEARYELSVEDLFREYKAYIRDQSSSDSVRGLSERQFADALK